MKKMLATLSAAFGALPVLAQDSGYTVPSAVTGAIDDLTNATQALAGAAAPALGKVVLAFAACALILWVGRFIWRKAQGRG